MLGSLKKLFEERVAPQIANSSSEAREHGLRLAAAVLLFEVVRADGTVKDEELTVMRAALQGTFGLARDEAEEIVLVAGEASRGAASLYEFTALVDGELGFDELLRRGQ
mgnify:CR=1 FL=1